MRKYKEIWRLLIAASFCTLEPLKGWSMLVLNEKDVTFDTFPVANIHDRML